MRPYKKKVFSQQTRLGFSYKARDGDTAMKATGRPKEGHRIFPEGHRIFPKPQDVGGENYKAGEYYIYNIINQIIL